METLPKELSWIGLEHQVAQILSEQEVYGWSFDEQSAQQLEITLGKELFELKEQCVNATPFVAGKEFTPKRPNKTRGYVADAPFTRLTDFNPTSRDHIAWVMQTHHGWKPNQFTEKGKPTIDESVLKEIGIPESLRFFRMLELTKHLGMLSEGKNAWLRLVRNGRLHHHCSVNCATHRCAHRNPNLAQVPSDLSFRKLFTASPGMVMVGADLQAIELRMLAHYLSRYDGGQFADNLLNDDIHQINADKMGISRKLVKTVTYAFLYGAGDIKIGMSYDHTLSSAKAKVKGKEIRVAFVSSIEGLGQLSSAVQKKAKTHGHIKSIDGRKILCDSPHKALNYLLQSGAGVVAKRWMVIAHELMTLAKLKFNQLAFIHDELQFDVEPDNSSHVAKILESSASLAGKFYDLRLPIAAEAKVGMNWAEVH